MNDQIETIYETIAIIHRKYWNKGVHDRLAKIDAELQELENYLIQLETKEAKQ